MCGIVGLFQVTGEPRLVIGPETFDAMTDVLLHRGPDDRGVVAGPGFALGARRLSIVDVEGGHQPVGNEQGTVVAIQNGELYNHLHIRPELEAAGHVLRSRCDTEILPHLYEGVGPGSPNASGASSRSLCGTRRSGAASLLAIAWA